MTSIPLSRRGTKHLGVFAVIVDDDIAPMVAAFRWRALAQGSGPNRRVYAVRRVTLDDGRPADLRMHRVIWERVNGPIPPGFEVDHIEPGELGGLDNRLSNLRLTTKALNQANSRRPKNNTSGFKGVWWQKQAQRWRADIVVDGRKVHIGYFEDKVAAALAYDAAARQFFGEFARVNFPTGRAA